jgi:hypothetical protein
MEPLNDSDKLISFEDVNDFDELNWIERLNIFE